MNFLPVKIGLRYLLSKKSNHSISFFSAISFLGLSVGVAAIIVVLSVMNRFQDEMHIRILGMVPHIAIESLGSANKIDLHNWQALAAKVIGSEPNLQSAAPYIVMEGMLKKGDIVKGVRVSGIKPEAESEVSVIDDFMIAGDLNSLSASSNHIILGSKMARELGLVVGDNLTFIMPVKSDSIAGLSPKITTFTVTGFFNVGYEADSLFAYVHIADAAKIKTNGSEGAVEGLVEGIRFSLQDLTLADKVGEALGEKYAGRYKVLSWASLYGQLFQTVRLEKVMTGFMLMLIVLVAAFNIISSLIMLVAEKHISIAVLRTMGLSPKQVSLIFLVQGAFIGLIGVSLGVGVGVLIAYNLEAIINLINSMDLVWIIPMQASVEVQDVMVISALAFCLSVLATIIPSIRASAIEPADAVRYR